MLFEVQKYGVTLDIDKKFKQVESAFLGAQPGGVVLYKLDPSTCKKVVLRKR